MFFFVGFDKISKRQSPERARSESLHEGREGPERPCVFAEPQQPGVILTWPTPSGKVSPEDLKAGFLKQGVEISPHLDTKNNNITAVATTRRQV